LSYEIRIIHPAEKELDRLPNTIQKRIIKRILSLENNPHPRGAHKLSGREEYRLRVGGYRILYTIDDSERMVTIMAVGHRRDVYN